MVMPVEGIAVAEAARHSHGRGRRTIVLTLVDRYQAINQNRVDVRVGKLPAQRVLLEHPLFAHDRESLDGVGTFRLERTLRLLLERAALSVRVEQGNDGDAPERAAIERGVRPARLDRRWRHAAE